MDSTGKFLVVVLVLLSIDYAILKTFNLINWKLKDKRNINNREEKYKDNDFWEG